MVVVVVVGVAADADVDAVAGETKRAATVWYTAERGGDSALAPGVPERLASARAANAEDGDSVCAEFRTGECDGDRPRPGEYDDGGPDTDALRAVEKYDGECPPRARPDESSVGSDGRVIDTGEGSATDTRRGDDVDDSRSAVSGVRSGDGFAAIIGFMGERESSGLITALPTGRRTPPGENSSLRSPPSDFGDDAYSSSSFLLPNRPFTMPFILKPKLDLRRPSSGAAMLYCGGGRACKASADTVLAVAHTEH